MRVAILMLNRGRGSGEVARAHARGLVALGHAVTLIVPGEVDLPPGVRHVDVKLSLPTVPVHEYLPQAGASQQPVHAMGRSEAEAYLPDYERALASVIEDVDIVICHHGNLTAIATHAVCAAHATPYVVFAHGTGIEPRHGGGYDDAIWARIAGALESAAGVLVTTEYVRDVLLLPLVDLPTDRIEVLPCGVDLVEFAPGRTGDVVQRYDLPEQFVICPGALTATKGPQNVVAASERYADIAPTIFIGDGDDRPALERALGERGRFLGYVPAEHKAWLINQATLVTAAPVKKEHFGIIYVEALAAGTPPVAYRGGGVDSIITLDTGVLTDRDPAALGDAIRSALGDPHRRMAMASAGRQRAEAHYDYDVIVARLAAWLDGLR